MVTLWLLSLGQPCRETGGWLPCAFLDIQSIVLLVKFDSSSPLNYAVGTLTIGVAYTERRVIYRRINQRDFILLKTGELSSYI